MEKALIRMRLYDDCYLCRRECPGRPPVGKDEKACPYSDMIPKPWVYSDDKERTMPVEKRKLIYVSDD